MPLVGSKSSMVRIAGILLSNAENSPTVNETFKKIKQLIRDGIRVFQKMIVDGNFCPPV